MYIVVCYILIRVEAFSNEPFWTLLPKKLGRAVINILPTRFLGAPNVHKLKSVESPTTNLEQVKNLITGFWIAANQQVIHVYFNTETTGICVRQAGDARRSDIIFWDAEQYCIWFGRKCLYFTLAEELARTPDRIVWYGCESNSKHRRRFAWSRLRGPAMEEAMFSLGVVQSKRPTMAVTSATSATPLHKPISQSEVRPQLEKTPRITSSIFKTPDKSLAATPSSQQKAGVAEASLRTQQNHVNSAPKSETSVPSDQGSSQVDVTTSFSKTSNKTDNDETCVVDGTQENVATEQEKTNSLIPEESAIKTEQTECKTEQDLCNSDGITEKNFTGDVWAPEHAAQAHKEQWTGHTTVLDVYTTTEPQCAENSMQALHIETHANQQQTGNVVYAGKDTHKQYTAPAFVGVKGSEFNEPDWTRNAAKKGDTATILKQIEQEFAEQRAATQNMDVIRAEDHSENGREQMKAWLYQNFYFAGTHPVHSGMIGAEGNDFPEDIHAMTNEFVENGHEEAEPPAGMHSCEEWHSENWNYPQRPRHEEGEFQNGAGRMHKWEDYLTGLWTGSKGRTYEITFETQTEGTCIRWEADGESRASPIYWDQQRNMVVWGDNYYMDYLEFVRHPRIARWYGFGYKEGYIYEWHRIDEARQQSAPSRSMQWNAGYADDWNSWSWNGWGWPHKGKSYPGPWQQGPWGKGMAIKGAPWYHKGKGKHSEQVDYHSNAANKKWNRVSDWNDWEKSEDMTEYGDTDYDKFSRPKLAWVPKTQKHEPENEPENEPEEHHESHEHHQTHEFHELHADVHSLASQAPFPDEPDLRFITEVEDGTTWRL